MANALYTPFKTHLAKGNIDLSLGTIKAILIDTASYTFSAAHEYVSSVAAPARIQTGTLAGKTVSAGVFDATDLLLSWTPAAVVDAIVLYCDTGTESSSPLIAYIDSYTGIPSASVSSKTIQWPAAGILTIA